MNPAAQFAFVRHSDEGLLVQEIDRDGNLEYLHSDDQSWDSLGGTWEIVAISDLTEEEKESAVFEEWEDKVIDSELFPSPQVFFLLEATYMRRDREGMGHDCDSRGKWFETEQEARAAFADFQESHKESATPDHEGSISIVYHQTAALFAYQFNQQPFSQELERKDAEDERNLDCWQQPIAWN